MNGSFLDLVERNVDPTFRKVFVRHQLCQSLQQLKSVLWSPQPNNVCSVLLDEILDHEATNREKKESHLSASQEYLFRDVLYHTGDHSKRNPWENVGVVSLSWIVCLAIQLHWLERTAASKHALSLQKTHLVTSIQKIAGATKHF